MEICTEKRNWLKACHDKSISVAKLILMSVKQLFTPKNKNGEGMRVEKGAEVLNLVVHGSMAEDEMWGHAQEWFLC